MHLIDTHCHIHDQNSFPDPHAILGACRQESIGQLICIGTSGDDSERAVAFAQGKPGVYASIGLHPHDAKLGEDTLEQLVALVNDPKVVAIGEFGLDYYYENSPKTDQKQAMEYQLQLALSFNKPCVFHVRDAFEDFFAILDNFSGIRGVVHSFTGTVKDVDSILARGLFMGVNGIATFTKVEEQKAAYKHIPLEKLVLETDAPFLTPVPLRGTMNLPANVRYVAACLAEMRGKTLAQLTEATTLNAQTLFSLPNEQL